MNLEAVVRRYSDRYNLLRTAAGVAAGRAWDRLGGLTDEHADRFTAAAVPLVATAQTAQGATTGAYYELIDRHVTGDASTITMPNLTDLRGVAPDDVYRRPIIEARAGIARGHTFDESMELGRNRAVSLAQTDVTLAQRAATLAAVDQLDQVVGYRRVLTGFSCPLCANTGGSYSRDEPMPIHVHCDCSSAPVYRTIDPAKAVNAAVLDELGSPDVNVAIEDHGELGPVLVDGDDDFSDL